MKQGGVLEVAATTLDVATSTILSVIPAVVSMPLNEPSVAEPAFILERMKRRRIFRFEIEMIVRSFRDGTWLLDPNMQKSGNIWDRGIDQIFLRWGLADKEESPLGAVYDLIKELGYFLRTSRERPNITDLVLYWTANTIGAICLVPTE